MIIIIIIIIYCLKTITHNVSIVCTKIKNEKKQIDGEKSEWEAASRSAIYLFVGPFT